MERGRKESRREKRERQRGKRERRKGQINYVKSWLSLNLDDKYMNVHWIIVCI